MFETLSYSSDLPDLIYFVQTWLNRLVLIVPSATQAMYVPLFCVSGMLISQAVSSETKEGIIVLSCPTRHTSFTVFLFCSK